MATYKQRALTIATVGVLSGVALTIATDGLLQLPEGPTPTPTPTEVSRPVAAGGRLEVPYSNQYRFVSKFGYQLRLESKTRYLPAVFNTYHHRSTLYHSVIGHGTAYQPLLAIHNGRFLWSLKASHIAQQTAPEHRSGLFRYGLSLKSSVSAAPAMRIIHDVVVPLEFKLQSETRFLPVITEAANVYSNIQLAHVGLRVESKYRFIPSVIKTYRHKVTSAFGISGKAIVQYISADLSSYKHRGIFNHKVVLFSEHFIDHAPIEIRDDDEEVLILAANYLLSDDDDG